MKVNQSIYKISNYKILPNIPLLVIKRLGAILHKVIKFLLLFVLIFMNSELALSQEGDVDNEEFRQETLKALENTAFCYDLTKQIIMDSNNFKKNAYLYIKSSLNNEYILTNATKNVGYIQTASELFNTKCKNYIANDCPQLTLEKSREIISNMAIKSDNEKIENEEVEKLIVKYAKEKLGYDENSDTVCLDLPEYDEIAQCCVGNEFDPLIKDVELKVESNIEQSLLSLANEEVIDPTKVITESVQEEYEKKFKDVEAYGFCDNALDNIGNQAQYDECVRKRIEEYKKIFTDKHGILLFRKSILDNWDNLAKEYNVNVSRPEKLWRLMEYYDRLEMTTWGFGEYKNNTLSSLLSYPYSNSSTVIGYAGQTTTVSGVTYSSHLKSLIKELDEVQYCDIRQMLFLYILKNYNTAFFIEKLKLSENVAKLYNKCTSEYLYSSDATTPKNMLAYFDMVAKNGQYRIEAIDKTKPNLLPSDDEENFIEPFKRVKNDYKKSAIYQKFLKDYTSTRNCVTAYDKQYNGEELPSNIDEERFLNLSIVLDYYGADASWMNYNQNVINCKYEEKSEYYYFPATVNNKAYERIEELKKKTYLNIRELGDLYAYSDQNLCKYFRTCGRASEIREMFVDKTSPSWALKFKWYQREIRIMPMAFYDNSHLYETSWFGLFNADMGFVVNFVNACKEAPLPISLAYEFTLGFAWEGANQIWDGITGKDAVGNEIDDVNRIFLTGKGLINYAFVTLSSFSFAKKVSPFLTKKLESAKRSVLFMKKLLIKSGKDKIKEGMEVSNIIANMHLGFPELTENELSKMLDDLEGLYYKIIELGSKIERSNKTIRGAFSRLNLGGPFDALAEMFSSAFYNIKFSQDRKKISELGVQIVNHLKEKHYSPEQILTMSKMIEKTQELTNGKTFIAKFSELFDMKFLKSLRKSQESSLGMIEKYRSKMGTTPAFLGHPGESLIVYDGRSYQIYMNRVNSITQKVEICKLEFIGSAKYTERNRVYIIDPSRISDPKIKSAFENLIDFAQEKMQLNVARYKYTIEIPKEDIIEEVLYPGTLDEKTVYMWKKFPDKEVKVYGSIDKINGEMVDNRKFLVKIEKSSFTESDATKLYNYLTEKGETAELIEILGENGIGTGKYKVFYINNGEKKIIEDVSDPFKMLLYRLNLYKPNVHEGEEILEAFTRESKLFEQFLIKNLKAKKVAHMAKDGDIITAELSLSFSKAIARNYESAVNSVVDAAYNVARTIPSRENTDLIIQRFCNGNATNLYEYSAGGFERSIKNKPYAYSAMPIGITLGASSIYVVDPKESIDVDNNESNDEPYLLFIDVGPSKVMCIEGDEAREAREYFDLDAESE